LFDDGEIIAIKL